MANALRGKCAPLGRREVVMANFVFGIVLVAMLSAPFFVAISCSEASAQERETCSHGHIAASSRSAKGGTRLACMLDCGASEKMRIAAAIRGMRALPPHELCQLRRLPATNLISIACFPVTS